MRDKRPKMYSLTQKIVLPTTLEKAWTFFSDPRNLMYITPVELAFDIQTPLKPGEFYPGMTIEYTVRPIAGIPMRWISEIRDIDVYKSFTDVQLKGPYRFWEHRHEFREVQGGVEMIDTVQYRLPLGFLGRIMHRMLVRKKLEWIFAYRTQRMNFLFTQAKRIA